ncbi:3-methyl-2-oxobutanoate hydroxymethyltransferase [Helicobacter mustelae]|uniref:3-methyl-2-oxobutanoate hydroxymethyltransferase n=1 Tax=Helicobacter mustelae (strain ATCC 43772 / CCUG 25715 / CIP 103759 / LMG 18044 / NCTC 12198 / R85-136P) TaxID=679897 RepID=D3UG21_HELM1|nr:3-methyl-2-oxobutanoate hydroxymethyltransferase [Helicobacter mustelae]CBG39442.1 3-methyl-2-oxobutanoate hydroxymethyltransferase [Helicobacter mustelae 12198]SQH70954.1 3-methyl-2-oxobutanoate hydroxymethyltransferase [Helicobacter mustelae]
MKTTITSLQKKKNQEKITAITAYDALFGGIFDGEVDFILVGDSLSQSFGGRVDTLGVSIDEMIYHTKAVCRGVQDSLVIGDMSFGSYQNIKQAVKNATRFYKQTRAGAIKLEGGMKRVPIIKAIIDEGIAVMGHIGLMPQFARSEGGYKIKGRDAASATLLKEEALALQEAGVFGIVLEGVKREVAAEITKTLHIPTIGIGSGEQCDGQILVWSDVFGFFRAFKPKFVRHYLQGEQLLKNAIAEYVSDVKSGNFPSLEESY